MNIKKEEALRFLLEEDSEERKFFLEKDVFNEREYLDEQMLVGLHSSYDFFKSIEKTLNIKDVLGIELPIEIENGNVVFSGTVDSLILSNKNKVYVIDIKSTKRDISESRKMQLAFYSMLVKNKFNLDYYPIPVVISPEDKMIQKVSEKIVEEKLALIKILIQKVIKSYMYQHFPPSTGKCGVCGYRKVCNLK